jgi:hypothetical protein
MRMLSVVAVQVALAMPVVAQAQGVPRGLTTGLTAARSNGGGDQRLLVGRQQEARGAR